MTDLKKDIEYKSFIEVIDKVQKNIDKEISLDEMEVSLENYLKKRSQAKSGLMAETLSETEKREAGVYSLEDLTKDIKNSKDGLKTGLTKLDEEISLHEGEIIIVGGRPANGKTTTKLNILANQLELYPDYSFCFFGYEGNLKSTALRFLQILSGFEFSTGKQKDNYQEYLKGNNTNIKELEAAKKKYEEYISTGRLKLFAHPYEAAILSDKIRESCQETKIGAVFIDYIQKIKNKRSFATRQLELQKTSEMLLETASENNIPIILGAQFGRDKERKDKVKLDNLRECGDIEQDASIVLGIYNDEVENEGAGSKDFTITVLKNRDGEVGKEIELDFNRKLLKISNATTWS